MRMHKKEDLTFDKDHGYILDKEGNVILVGFDVVNGLNHIEEMYQRQKFMSDHPVPVLEDMPEFEYESAFNRTFNDFGYECKPLTPTLDEDIKKSKAILEEIKGIETVDRMNELLARFLPVINWISGDTILGADGPVLSVPQFDLKYLGNPLEIDKDKIFEILFEEAAKEE